MRVISQCGRGDFPYEQISLVIRNFGQPNQWLIVAHGLYFKDDLGTRIAEYSTEEKAKDAMSYLHAKYNEFIFDKYANYKIDATFRFPADDEI